MTLYTATRRDWQLTTAADILLVGKVEVDGGQQPLGIHVPARVDRSVSGSMLQQSYLVARSVLYMHDPHLNTNQFSGYHSTSHVARLTGLLYAS